MSTKKLIKAGADALKNALRGKDWPKGLQQRLTNEVATTIDKVESHGDSAQSTLDALNLAAEAISKIDLHQPETINGAFAAISAANLGHQPNQLSRRFRNLGWKRDLPDPRDQVYSAPIGVLKALPPKVDLRGMLPAAYNQGYIGSCTANAIGACVQFVRRKSGETPDFVPSRLFIYYNEREAEGNISIDSGAFLRTGFKSIAKQGICHEDDWPYDSAPADEATRLFPSGCRATMRPTDACYADAKTHVAISYWTINQSLSQMKGCLAEGYPFAFGFSIFRSFYDANWQPIVNVRLPHGGDENLGGHAVVALGYDDAKQVFIVRNSWGTDMQDNGHFYMPYAYLTDAYLSADFWTVRAISS